MRIHVVAIWLLFCGALVALCQGECLGQNSLQAPEKVIERLLNADEVSLEDIEQMANQLKPYSANAAAQAIDALTTIELTTFRESIKAKRLLQLIAHIGEASAGGEIADEIFRRCQISKLAFVKTEDSLPRIQMAAEALKTLDTLKIDAAEKLIDTCGNKNVLPDVRVMISRTLLKSDSELAKAAAKNSLLEMYKKIEFYDALSTQSEFSLSLTVAELVWTTEDPEIQALVLENVFNEGQKWGRQHLSLMRRIIQPGDTRFIIPLKDAARSQWVLQDSPLLICGVLEILCDNFQNEEVSTAWLRSESYRAKTFWIENGDSEYTERIFRNLFMKLQAKSKSEI